MEWVQLNKSSMISPKPCRSFLLFTLATVLPLLKKHESSMRHRNLKFSSQILVILVITAARCILQPGVSHW